MLSMSSFCHHVPCKVDLYNALGWYWFCTQDQHIVQFRRSQPAVVWYLLGVELSSKDNDNRWKEKASHPISLFPCRIFPLTSARLFVKPGRPQPWRGRVEAGCEPGHQELSDPGEALSGFFSEAVAFTLVNTANARLDLWRYRRGEQPPWGFETWIWLLWW